MTEDVLDKLRTHAERMADEAHRFQRSLRGSSANEEQVREHLANVEVAVAACRRDGLPVAVVEAVSVPFVQAEPPAPTVETVVTVTPPVEQPKPVGRRRK